MGGILCAGSRHQSALHHWPQSWGPRTQLSQVPPHRAPIPDKPSLSCGGGGLSPVGQKEEGLGWRTAAHTNSQRSHSRSPGTPPPTLQGWASRLPPPGSPPCPSLLFSLPFHQVRRLGLHLLFYLDLKFIPGGAASPAEAVNPWEQTLSESQQQVMCLSASHSPSAMRTRAPTLRLWISPSGPGEWAMRPSSLCQ